MNVRWPSLLLALLLPGTALAATPAFQEGASYEALDTPLPTEAKPGQVEVVEFFWYGCPHCFALEPQLEVWVKQRPKYVVYRHIPEALQGSEFYTDAQAFYTAQALGIGEKIHEPFFNAIHLDGDGALRDDVGALRDFFGKFGVAPKDFDAAWSSFAVQSHMSQAAQLEEHSNIMEVPLIVVDGKWKTGAGYRLASGDYMSAEQIMQCVQFLVEKEKLAHGK